MENDLHKRCRLRGIYLILLLGTLAVFGGLVTHDFISFDDWSYVVKNPRVQGGLSLHNVAWAFTTGYQGNWHPLTWMSHMLDCQLYGLKAGGHHLTSLFLHAANTLLLFGV